MMLTPFMVVGDMFSFDDDTLEPSNPQPQLTQQASGKAPYPYLTVGISYMYVPTYIYLPGREGSLNEETSL